jgi:hypothetical protein
MQQIQIHSLVALVPAENQPLSASPSIEPQAWLYLVGFGPVHAVFWPP